LDNKPQIHTVLKPKTPEEKYGKLAKFIREDLNLQEEKELQTILEDRKEKIKEIKEILIKAKKEGNFEEKILEVEKIREEITNKILAYVKEEKKDAFIELCKK
jgi:hypothetical protein